MQNTQLHRQIAKRPAARPSMPRPVRKSRRWLPYAVLGGAALTVVTMVGCALSLLLIAALSAGRIPNGVSVASLSVGGRTVEEAQAALRQLDERVITLADNDRLQDVRLSDLGITVDTEATIEQAQDAPAGTTVTPVYHVDLVQAQAALVDLSQRFNIAPVAGDPPQMGRAVDIPVILDRLRTNPAGELADGTLDLVMIEVAPPEPEPGSEASYTGETTTHIVEPGQELGLIAKLYNVSVADITSLNGITNPDLLYIGQELTIPAAGVYQPTAEDAPAPSTTVGKAIVVSVSRQRIYAFDNGQLVHSDLVSTGLPQTPTVLGDYSIYVKYRADDMSGPGYYLPQVPYTMYFYSGYAIHGTYWHNAFGRPMSHGCVNLPVGESAWFFDWAQVGTPVRVVV